MARSKVTLHLRPFPRGPRAEGRPQAVLPAAAGRSPLLQRGKWSSTAHNHCSHPASRNTVVTSPVTLSQLGSLPPSETR